MRSIFIDLKVRKNLLQTIYDYYNGYNDIFKNYPYVLHYEYIDYLFMP